MAGNALCDYCDVDSGLGEVNGDGGGGFNDFFQPIWDMVVSALSTIAEILADLVLWAFCGIAEGMLYIANTLAFPDFMNSLNEIVLGQDSVILYLMARSGVSEALLIVSGGISFYVLRKFITLGKW